MTNFIFKSSTDLQKISQQLKVILNEQKLQRCDLAFLKSTLLYLKNDKVLQKSVDEYFEEDATSPQTESDNKRDLD